MDTFGERTKLGRKRLTYMLACTPYWMHACAHTHTHTQRAHTHTHQEIEGYPFDKKNKAWLINVLVIPLEHYCDHHPIHCQTSQIHPHWHHCYRGYVIWLRYSLFKFKFKSIYLTMDLFFSGSRLLTSVE